jgi:hypothetical protein
MPDVAIKQLPPNDLIRPKDANGEPLVPFTCPWAQDGLRRAMEGMVGTGTGVKGYHIGRRGVEFRTPGEQASTVDYWMKMVEYYCGAAALPPWMTGRDTACRVILRDV